MAEPSSFGDSEQEIRDADRMVKLQCGPLTPREAREFETFVDDFGRRLSAAREQFGIEFGTMGSVGSVDDPMLECGHTEKEHTELMNQVGAGEIPEGLQELLQAFRMMGAAVQTAQSYIEDSDSPLIGRNPFHTPPGRA